MSRIFALMVIAVSLFATGCGSKEPAQKYTKPSTANTVAAPGKAALTDESAAVVASKRLSQDLIMDWPQFRGPQGLANTENARVPLRWREGDGIVWKTELPGRGASTPIVFSDRIFVTAFTGYGMSNEDRGKLADLQHHVICLDKKTGHEVWKRTIQGSYANQSLTENLLGHGFASSTPVTDGKSLFTFFGVSGVFAFDLDGKFLWQADVGVMSDNFGSSASLAVFEDLLFVNASIESKTLFALDKSTGKAVWKFDGVERSWSTPLIGLAEDKSPELILNQTDTVHGFDPRTGEQLWFCEGIHDYVVPAPIVVNGICYINGGREKRLMAIKLGGRGDVTQTNKLWEVPQGANVSSSVYHDGKLFICADNGIMQCFDAESGEMLNRQRTGSKKRVFSSPVIVGDHLFLPTYDQGVIVMKADEDCKIVVKNTFAEDDGPFQASIAASGNQLFLRNDAFLYCLGSVEGGTGVAQVDPSPALHSDVIIPNRKYDFDETEGRAKQYLKYFITDPDNMVEFILKPYESVITSEQTAKSDELIRANHQPFLELREQYINLNWDFRQGAIAEEEFVKKLTRIENLTIRQNRKVRKMVKDMFSKAQMDQHLREAKAHAAKKANAEGE